MSVIHQVLAKYFGYSQFRPMQEEIIQSVLDGNDTLALLPTGGGKSICFQVPALAMEGICVVISPLIALMKDQEEQLKEKGIRASAIVSGMSKSEIDIILGNCIYGNYKFIYISPERLASEDFIAQLLKMPVNMFAIDEAHCISQWGYDFRPPYLKIASIREHFPNIPVMALTASATPEVRDDICNKLNFKSNKKVFSKSFARPNLSYIVRHEDNKQDRLLRVLNTIPGTSIVYVRNRRKTQELANWLNAQGISADFYHAGLNFKVRNEKQERWMNNKTRVIVSTNAFGMGINKPDVRSVIHVDLPDDLESYYQEAGRGGRDEKQSYAVVLYNNTDINDIERKINVNFPEIDEVKNVYQALGNYYQMPIGNGEGQQFNFEILEFSANYRFDPIRTLNCIKILELEGFFNLSDAVFLPSRIKIQLKNLDLYNFQVQHKEFDPIIKLILRSYSGLFDDFVKVNESELARKLNINRDDAVNQIKKLHTLEVLEYLPASDIPRITFNYSRVELKHLKINKQNLEDRKQRYIVRSNAFKEFILSKHKCRSMMLLSYFGEDNLSRCGTCDYCRERNKLEFNDIEMESISISIKTHLQKKAMLPHEIAFQFPKLSGEKVAAIVRWMLDNGDLKKLPNGLITLIKD